MENNREDYLEDPPKLSRVWIVNFAGHDFSPAKKWGEIAAVTTGYVDPALEDRVIYNIAKQIQESSAEDWLCVGSGLAIVNVIVSLLWLKKHKQIKMLLWNRKQGSESDYIEKIVTENHLEFLFETMDKALA